MICPQQCAQPVETPPQEAKSPANPTEAEEKKVEEPEVKERPDEPMEVESKGISREVVNTFNMRQNKNTNVFLKLHLLCLSTSPYRNRYSQWGQFQDFEQGVREQFQVSQIQE